MKNFFLLGVLAASLTGSLSALPITLFNTGVNGTGIDPRYVISTSNDSSVAAGASARVIANPNGGWSAPLAGTSWINATGSGTLESCGNCYYAFTTTFDLAGLNPLTAIINGQVMADDTVAIFLNGVAVTSWIGGYTQPVSFSIASSTNAPYQNGMNSLSFAVWNSGGGPTGLDVKMSGTANASAVPEPGSFGMLAGAGALFLWLGLFRRGARAKKLSERLDKA